MAIVTSIEALPRRAETVIVGGGSAGAVIARRLVEAGRSVVLLEAGPAEPTRPEAIAAVRNAKQPAVAPGVNWGIVARIRGEAGAAGLGSVYRFEAGRLLGGSSAINATLACRGAPADYDEWAQTCGEQWSWQSVLPFFRKLEDDQDGATELHGRGGPLPIRREGADALLPVHRAFERAALAAGAAACADHNDPATTGVGPFPKNALNGLRISTKQAYLDPVLDDPGLSILSEAEVHALEWEGARVSGLRIVSQGQSHLLAAERVIVCAGALGSPQILQRSGIGDAERLRRLDIGVHVNLPAVGEGLMDHPVVGIWGVPKPEVCELGETARQVLWRWTSAHAVHPNDMHLCMVAGIDLHALFPSIAQQVNVPTLAGLLATNNHSYSRGHVRITSRELGAAPDVVLNCLADHRDIPPLMEGVRKAWALLQGAELKQVFAQILAWTARMVESDRALEQAVKTFVRPAAHLGGSLKMGHDSVAGTVVGPSGKIHGLDNVWVADMSVVPMVPCAPPNLTCLMLAERLSTLNLEAGAW